ncbi:uncharacterized protein LOC126666065 [Mercurialis annua]|uniref:uncharacterized protein LOC126666065 n=1 Tax=Mercurialis annua TaxID=3986 RepID=UPI00215E59EE|nr:uncharacterized protein LOC126666065 [Mercurialis annua]
MDISSLDLNYLSPDQAAGLIQSFHESEIFSALNSCNETKAPGPDGFNYFFYKRAWSFIKNDIIDLVNGIYKLLSKCLSARLAPLISSVISDHQHVFIEDMNIMDYAMISNELIHFARKRKDKLLVLKLDFHKAPSDPFPLKKTSSLGDLISPYLFVLTAEGLKSILQKLKDLGLINGFVYFDDHDQISVLQFADDSILFLPFDLEHLWNLTRILRCFELIAALKINFHKSSLLGINVS